MRWLRAMFCRHHDTQSITYTCGCCGERCACGALRDAVCTEHSRFTGYTQRSVGW